MARGKDKEDNNQNQDQQKVEIQRDKFGLRDVMARAANRLSDRADVLNKRGQQQMKNAQNLLSRDTARFERVKAAHDRLQPPAAIAARQKAGLPANTGNDSPPESPAELLADIFEEPPKPKPKTSPKPPPPPGRELVASSIVPPPLPGDFEPPESLTDMGLAPRSRAANRFSTPVGRKFTEISLPSMSRPNRADFVVENNPNAPYVSFLMPGPNNVGERIKNRASAKLNANKPEVSQLSGAVPFGANFPVLPTTETTNLPPRAEPEPAANVPPQELVSAPVYDPNETRGRLPGTRRQILKFENPAFALLAGILSLTLLIGMVFLLVFLNSSLTRTSDERFVVMFASIGEGEVYANIPNGGGQVIARSISTNFVQNVNLDRIEIKSSGTNPRDAKEARRLGNSNGADIVVSGYREATGRMVIRLLISPNGPYDLPQGTGHQIALRALFEPDQLTFVTKATDLDLGSSSEVFKLLQGITAYYLGSYDVAERNLRELLAKKAPENEAVIRMFYANTLYLMGNYKDAETSYTTLVNLNQLALKQGQAFPINPAIVQSNRGVALYMNNNYPEAIKAFEAALATRKDLPKIYANYANFLIERTDLEYRPQLVADWKKNMEDALKIDKNIPLVYYNLGRLQNFQHDYDGALASFEQAHKLDPNLLEAYWEQGQVYFLKFEQDGDYTHINKALEVLRVGESRATILARQNRERSQAYQQSGNQTLTTIWYNWAIAQEVNLEKMRLGISRAFIEQTRLKGKDKGNPFDQLGRWVKNEKTPYEEASPRIQEALKTKPEDPETNFLYGQYLIITGEGDPLPYYQKAKTNERNSNKRFRYHQILAEQYQAQGKLQEALNEYAEYVKFDPNRVQGHIALAEAQYDLKQYGEAVASADRAIKLNDRDPLGYTIAAKAQIGQKQYQAALTYLEKALNINPKYAEGYFQQGIALFNLNKKNEALVAFNKAISLEITEPEAYYYAGVIYADNQSNPRSALPLWERAVRLRPKYAEAWARLATVYIQQNELDRAIDACEQAIAAEVKEGPIYYYQGVLLESRKGQGDLAKAEQRYKQAIGFTPGLLNAHVRLAEVILLQDTKRADEALQSAQRALQLDPRSAEANVALGNILRAKLDTDGAINAYNTALSLKKDLPDAYYGRSIALLNKNQLQQALSDIDQAINLNKNWSDAYLIKGIIHIGRKEYQPAQVSLEKVKSLNPADHRAYIQFGNLYEAQNQTDQAINAYEQGININANDIRFYARLGRLYLARNEVDRALEKLQKGQQLDPEIKTERIAYYLGRAYMLKTRYQDAKVALERQVQLEPTFIEARYELGNAYKTLGQNQEAITQYTEAVKLQPAFSQAWLDLGRVYQNSSNLAAARDAYQNALKSTDAQVREAAQVALNSLGR